MSTKKRWKNEKNVDLIQDLTKTFIYVYRKPPQKSHGFMDVIQTCDTVANKPFKVGKIQILVMLRGNY